VATRSGGGRSRSPAQREFVAEAEEILERMRAGLADLGDRLGSGQPAPPEQVNALFRAAHSLKGLSGMFGAEGMSELAHRLEDVLDRLRLGRVALDAAALSLLDAALTAFAARLGSVGEDGAGEAADLPELPALVERIEVWLRGDAAPPLGPDELDLDPATLRALTEYEEHRLRENLRAGRRILVVEALFGLHDFDEGLGRLITAIRESGEVLATLPSPGESKESQIRFSVLVATSLDARALAARLELPEAAVRAASRAGGAAGPASSPRVEAAHESLAAPVRPGLAPPPAPEALSLKSLSGSIRVDIAKLDELMNLVGELALLRGSFASLAAQLRGLPATARLAADLDQASRGLERRLQELQARVLQVRMVPLHQVFEKLSRVARRLRRDLGKEVRLEIRGGNTELDKLIVEELTDPLMHVVRNAFDHAIEPAAERVAAGKPAEGSVLVEARQRGNEVWISVRDDGRGIDADAVHARAVECGVVAPDAVLGAAERLQLVFAPGVTTRSEVTETSGRGVGMDVVRANVTSLGGMVEVDSAPGHGTTVTMILPITLAIVQVLVVGAAGQRFAIPLSAVRETLLVEPGQIQRSEGLELLNLRGEALPLRRLAAWLELGEPQQPGRRWAVVLGPADARLGLLVDRLESQQDAVIKPIQGPVQGIRGIAGATELGDAAAVLVLDVAALLDETPRRQVAA
jgi:two-component system chemotaxis sensor kinase CheA